MVVPLLDEIGSIALQFFANNFLKFNKLLVLFKPEFNMFHNIDPLYFNVFHSASDFNLFLSISPLSFYYVWFFAFCFIINSIDNDFNWL